MCIINCGLYIMNFWIGVRVCTSVLFICAKYIEVFYFFILIVKVWLKLIYIIKRTLSERIFRLCNL